MKVTIIGAGYVGLVTGACLSEVGHDVLCVDVDESKIKHLQAGRVPIFEPGLENLISANMTAGRLRFTSDLLEGARFGLIQMIAVGTPPGEDGSADLKYVTAAADAIERGADGYRVVVTKSTVPVGTTDMLRERLSQRLKSRSGKARFSLVSNPEFLREGAAIADFMRPERIVLGVDDPQAEAVMRQLYEPFQRNHDRLITMSARSSELTKYAANAMLATRISFMNDLANLADQINADIEDVRKGIGSDSRIGYSYLYAGTGYGGSCFPKDVQALIRTGSENGHPLQILEAVRKVNDSQRNVLIRKIMLRYDGNIAGKRFAVWGLTFKPDTDDMREAPARYIIEALLEAGATVQAYDPVAMDQVGALFGESPALTTCPSAMQALDQVDALIIATEWKAFRAPDFEQMRINMKEAVIFDGRNLFEPAKMTERGFEYSGIGRRGKPSDDITEVVQRDKVIAG